MVKKGPAPVYYFYGDEDLLIKEAVSEIKQKYLTPGFESMNLQVYEGKTLDVVDVVSVASTMPAFSEMRIVIIGGAESMKAAEQKAMLAYVKDPSPTTALIFYARTLKVNKSTALFKYISSKGWAKPFKELSEEGAARWAVKYAADNGKKLSSAGARRLVDVTGRKLSDLKGELEKLVCYVGEADGIEEKDVEESALSIKDDNAFDLAGAMATKKLGRALELLKVLSGEEPLMIIGGVAWHFRQLVRVKAFVAEGLDNYTMRGRLRVSPENVTRYLAVCRKYTESELLRVIGRLADADAAIKTGRLPGDLALVRLVMDCCRA